jgi:hypothetical protein
LKLLSAQSAVAIDPLAKVNRLQCCSECDQTLFGVNEMDDAEISANAQKFADRVRREVFLETDYPISCPPITRRAGYRIVAVTIRIL